MKCYICKSEYEPYELVVYFHGIQQTLTGDVKDKQCPEIRTLCKQCMMAFMAGVSAETAHSCVSVDWWPIK